MKTPTPRKLPSGAWFIQLRLNGVSIPITAETKTECINIAELTKAEYRSGKKAIKKTPKETTLAMAMQKYIDASRATLSPSTLRGYQVYQRTRFPDYRNKKLSEINFQKMIDDDLKLVSEKTVKNAWGLVHASLKHIDYPIPNVRLAKVPVNDIAFLQPDEIKLFCKAVKGRSYEIPALLMLHGLRLSEVRALDWKNVDLKRETIAVQGSNIRGEDGYILKKTNKNATSTRTLPIMIPQLKAALEAVKDKSGLVTTISPSVLLRDVKRACERAGVTVVTNHGLRHSFASLGYHLRIPERQLMAWGGWSDFTTMHKVYIRLASADESDAKAAVKNFFSEKQKSTTPKET